MLSSFSFFDCKVEEDLIQDEIIFSDWFLPSIAELKAMNDELHLYSVGGFVITDYASSTEFSNSAYSAYDFGGSFGVLNNSKHDNPRVRACRSFISTTNYNLRKIGPAGGLIFWKSGNNYLEACKIDDIESNTFNAVFSNMENDLIGTTGSIIGTGQINTLAIINQVGHILSAAKLCNDLIVKK